jgi:hypothetical protein
MESDSAAERQDGAPYKKRIQSTCPTVGGHQAGTLSILVGDGHRWRPPGECWFFSPAIAGQSLEARLAQSKKRRDEAAALPEAATSVCESRASPDASSLQDLPIEKAPWTMGQGLQ